MILECEFDEKTVACWGRPCAVPLEIWAFHLSRKSPKTPKNIFFALYFSHNLEDPIEGVGVGGPNFVQCSLIPGTPVSYLHGLVRPLLGLHLTFRNLLNIYSQICN